MKNIEEEKKIAVLIDADNAQYHRIANILSEISAKGHIITKRAYGDWSSDYLKNWKQKLNELAISPIQQYAYTVGKNSTDAHLIIDAMDLLYTEKYDIFVLVSSDSDFTSLASRLRESEEYVIGVGEQKTPISFRNSCDEFILVENLKDDTSQVDSKFELSNATKNEKDKIEKQDSLSVSKNSETASAIKTPDELFNESQEELTDLFTVYYQKQVEETGWANVAGIPTFVRRMKPDFDPRTYGFPRVQDMIRKMEGIFEITKLSGKNNVKVIAFRPKGIE
jgi:uncharacterized protein (TIGR00288 family)